MDSKRLRVLVYVLGMDDEIIWFVVSELDDKIIWFYLLDTWNYVKLNKY